MSPRPSTCTPCPVDGRPSGHVTFATATRTSDLVTSRFLVHFGVPSELPSVPPPVESGIVLVVPSDTEHRVRTEFSSSLSLAYTTSFLCPRQDMVTEVPMKEKMICVALRLGFTVWGGGKGNGMGRTDTDPSGAPLRYSRCAWLSLWSMWLCGFVASWLAWLIQSQPCFNLLGEHTDVNS